MEYIEHIRAKIGNDTLLMPTADCIVLDEQGRVLLQKRVDTKNWGMIGGMMQLGETVQEAAMRELQEEAGLRAELSLFGVYSGPAMHVTYPNGDKLAPVKIVFVAHVQSTVTLTTDSEGHELRFFALKGLPDNLLESHRRILQDLAAVQAGIKKSPIIE